MPLKGITAEVITCPGGLGDISYPALEIRLEAFDSPYVLTLALPAIVYKALSAQMDPLVLYDAIASAVNDTRATTELRRERGFGGRPSVRRAPPQQPGAPNSPADEPLQA